MNDHSFTNGLRILFSIDAHELGDPTWWAEFSRDPARFKMTADAPKSGIIWAALVKRGIDPTAKARAAQARAAFNEADDMAKAVLEFISIVCKDDFDASLDAAEKLNTRILEFRTRMIDADKAST